MDTSLATDYLEQNKNISPPKTEIEHNVRLNK